MGENREKEKETEKQREKWGIKRGSEWGWGAKRRKWWWWLGGDGGGGGGGSNSKTLFSNDCSLGSFKPDFSD